MDYLSVDEINYLGDIDYSILLISQPGSVCLCLNPVGIRHLSRQAKCLACGKALDLMASEAKGIAYLSEGLD